MIPGEVITVHGDIELNKGAPTVTLKVANTGDRPIQVGSHYHFFETNEGLRFERDKARGMRLDIAAGTAVRFEPGQERDVTLVPLGGKREVYGFQQKVMGQAVRRLSVIMLTSAAILSPVASQELDCENAMAQQDMNQCAYRDYEVRRRRIERSLDRGATGRQGPRCRTER